MLGGLGEPAGAAVQTGWARLRRAPSRPDPLSAETDLLLRTGVERGMVTTLAIASPFFVLMSSPGFMAEHWAEPALLVMSLCLAGVMVVTMPLALARRGTPVYGWFWPPVIAYLLLVALEPYQLRSQSAGASPPWLVVLLCVALGCAAIGILRPVRAALGSACLIGVYAAVDVGRVPTDHVVLEALGLLALSGGLIAGVTTLRIKADRADQAERCARELFERSRQQTALEAERVRTDALLHDTVLAALSAAAAGYDAPEQTVLMARTALDIVSNSATDRLERHDSTTLFGCAVATAKREFAPLHHRVAVDLDEVADVELPSAVAEAMVSAMLQALSNSVKHAGAGAVCSATAARTDDGGVQIRISDDGAGFDLAQVSTERLGIRVSIVERMQMVGATADVSSSPGRGTTVHLEWRPGARARAAQRPSSVRA